MPLIHPAINHPAIEEVCYGTPSVSILGFENCQSFFPTTAHVCTVYRNARRTAMRGAHQFDWHSTCQTLKTAAEHHIQTTV